LLTRSGLTYPQASSKICEEMTTESQRYNCFTRNGGNAIPKHAGQEAKGSNPAAGLTLLWARNPFRGISNHWQVSVKRETCKFTDNSGTDFRGGQRVLVESSMWTVYARHDEKVICSTRSPFLSLLPRRAQYGRCFSFEKRVWFTESHIVLFTQFIVDKLKKKRRAVSS